MFYWLKRVKVLTIFVCQLLFLVPGKKASNFMVTQRGD